MTKVLATTHLTSTVAVESDGEGATIRYRRVGDQDAQAKTAKDAKAKVRIGLFHIWTERDGRATSRRNECFQIVRQNERIKIRENR